MTAVCRLPAATALLAAVLVLLAATTSAAAPSLPADWQKGMTMTNDKYCNVSYASDKAHYSLKMLASTGANWVTFIVTQYQKKHNTTAIFPIYTPQPSGYYTYVTASDDSLRSIIGEAHKLGLSVMLKPHIDLTEDPKFWRGQIGAGFTPDDWPLWFSNYTSFITHYARLAESEKVEQFSLSCELIYASVQHASSWRQMLKDVRAVYSGSITNAANWGYLNATGGQATWMTWWDAPELDFIGVDGYWPLLPRNETPSVETIEAAWAPAVQRLTNLTRKWGKPVILTEIGYCSGVNDTCPRGHASSPLWQQNQANYYAAALNALSKLSFFKGIHWWAWNTDPAFGGAHDGCITPQFKPAEKALRDAYGGTTVLPRPTYPATCICTV
eukprot:PLAT2934.1.p1 GENE.PLAT2934.1~~PLAT2934.1.p1  ORF type:complete len:404 (-),score=93.94 PLAT2934.1:80-1234(-)